MPTNIIRHPYKNLDSQGISPISPNVFEMQLFAHPNLLRWVDAEHGSNDGFIRCRKSDGQLIPVSAMPTRQSTGSASAAYNNKPVYVFGSGSANGRLKGDKWLPENKSFTVVFVGRNGPDDNAFIFGTGTGSPSVIAPHAGTIVQMISTGAWRGYFGGYPIGILSTYVRPHASGPSIISLSWDNSAKAAHCRVNRGAYEQSVTASGASLEGFDFILGAAGANGAGSIDGGDFAAVFIFDTCLDTYENTALRTALDSYLTSRFAIR